MDPISELSHSDLAGSIRTSLNDGEDKGSMTEFGQHMTAFADWSFPTLESAMHTSSVIRNWYFNQQEDVNGLATSSDKWNQYFTAVWTEVHRRINPIPMSWKKDSKKSKSDPIICLVKTTRSDTSTYSASGGEEK